MSPHFRNTLLLPLSLAAGCVDALGFLATGVFPANMTGNTVMLALALGRGNIPGITDAALVLTGFLIGALCGALPLRDCEEKNPWPATVSLVLAAAGVLLLGCGVSVILFGRAHMACLISVAAVAMGLQSSAVLALGVPGVATTVITGTLTTTMARVAGWLGGAGNRFSKASPGLPLASWIAYFAGAAIGGLHGLLGKHVALCTPVLSLLGVVMLAELSRQRRE